MSTRKHYNEYDVLTEAWILIKVLLKMSPKGAALLTAEINTRAVVPLLRSSFFFLYLCTQGSISGFALISPWALKKCRAYGTQPPPSPPSQSHPFHPFKSNNTHHSDFNDVHHSYLTTYTHSNFNGAHIQN